MNKFKIVWSLESKLDLKKIKNMVNNAQTDLPNENFNNLNLTNRKFMIGSPIILITQLIKT